MHLASSGRVLAPWTHNDNHNPTDPINLIFRGAALGDVVATLGWGTPLPGFGSTQYIHVDDDMEPQTDQRTLTFIWPIRRYRFHIRFWDMGSDGILAAAHREKTPVHVTEAFEEAEKTVAKLFVNNPNWVVQYDLELLGNELRQPPNNGYATRINRN